MNIDEFCQQMKKKLISRVNIIDGQRGRVEDGNYRE